MSVLLRLFTMKVIVSVVLLAFVCQGYCAVPDNPADDKLNDVPIIGILAQETSYHLNTKYPDQFKSYIAASYVKFVEGAGARVIPIWIDRPRSFYEDILSHVNGVLFPGGATFFNQSNGYSDAGRYIYEIAEEMNELGDYMPLWGTCLGFELLTYLSAKEVEHRADCSSHNQPLPLDFTNDFRDSSLFGSAPTEIIDILKSEPVTTNFHGFCVTEKNMTDLGLDSLWKTLSVNDDWNGLNYISTIEHRKYPFYGVMFHPEKNIYEWIADRNISHTPNAIKASQYFSTFFVNEARKSKHKFPSVIEENRYLIYNYNTTFTALQKSAYETCYLFDDTADYFEAYRSSASKIFSNEVTFISVIFLALFSTKF